jgi:neutral ceramidase
VLAVDRSSGVILAGAGRAEVDLPPGIPLAGYRAFGRAAEGPASPTHVRALILEAGGSRVGLVLVELMTLPPSLAERLREKAEAEGIPCAILAATHTHAGPGGYDRAFLPQAVAVGRFDQRVEDELVRAAAAALASARADLSAADLFLGEARQEGLAKNRDRPGAPVDDLLTRIDLLRPNGTPVARIVRHAAHATLTPRKVGPSGGWPAVVMAALEEEGGVAFLLQGAVADASAAFAGEKVKRAERDGWYGARVVERVRAVPTREVVPPVALGCAEVEFPLPPADVGGAVPAPFARLVSNLVSPFAPETARAAAVRLDDLVLLAVPGEPTRPAASPAEAALAGLGLRGRVVSLAQGYAGYAPLPEDFEDGVFSTRASWFGDALAPRFVEAVGVAASLVTPSHPADVPPALPLPGRADRGTRAADGPGPVARPD